MTIDDFTREYYENFDIEIFQSKLDHLKENLLKLESEKEKKLYSTEIYALYMQVVEIFCINVFAISENDLLGNIFLSNSKIDEKIRARFYGARNQPGDDFVSYIVSFVFANKDDTKDRTEQKRDYRHMVKEAVDDYLHDKHFLNSYKHGFRVFSGEKSSLSIGPTGGKSMFKLQDFSASLLYYTKDKDSVLQCSISFNWERVYAKTLILLNILYNIRNVYMSQGKEINFIHLTFGDREKIMSKFGCFRMCHEVAVVPKQTKI